MAQIQVARLSIENQISNDALTQRVPAPSPRLARVQLVLKWLIDKTVSLSALLLLFPLLVLIAVIIKLESKGPVLFLQNRNGLNNDIFKIWKFRTMKVMEDGNDVRQARKDDDRITRVGNFLRKTSLDELPQLANVLKGDMSLVGARPHPINLNDRFRPQVENYDKRNAMKPGLTGLAQIRGYRGPTRTAEHMALRVNADIEYIENWSLWLDIKIILLTPYYGLMTKNAF
jgi:putative colanic acid biosynthesis UDP-glucose lipid carrier transferase